MEGRQAVRLLVWQWLWCHPLAGSPVGVTGRAPPCRLPSGTELLQAPHTSPTNNPTQTPGSGHLLDAGGLNGEEHTEEAQEATQDVVRLIDGQTRQRQQP